jgi:hypothetical protein
MSTTTTSDDLRVLRRGDQGYDERRAGFNTAIARDRT